MDTLLTVNGGSSSLKCALFTRQAGHLSCLYIFKLGNILGDARFSVVDGTGNKREDYDLNLSDVTQENRHQAALQHVLDWLEKNEPDSQLIAIGHRVVHGGDAFSDPVLINEESFLKLRTFVALAPLHQPYNLKLIRACQALAPTLPQIACFDTMFHAMQPAEERDYALPRKYTEEGIRRYGFHGLSYEFIQRRLTAMQTGDLNTIICHLGAGASMCAVKGGQSIASSMGFTAVDGLPMGSRCGNLDPGVLLYLQRHYGMDADALEKLINKESGWLGVSGISSDMLELHQANNIHAEEAINMFAYRISLELGRLSAALQGVQQIVFTGGIGENDADLRQRVLQRTHWLGVDLDEDANKQGAPVISTKRSQTVVRIIPTDEEAMIATHIEEILAAE